MSCVIDLASRRHTPRFLKLLSHPAGVSLPFYDRSDADIIIPEVRSAICDGAYSANMIRLLPDVVRAGDRVLVIGAGLGVVSTLVAKTEGVARVIAVEANSALISYLNRVHDLNGVSEVEVINAVLTEGKRGRVPFFTPRDIRTSSTLLHDRLWQQAMMVPVLDLELILTEERISLIVCEIPTVSAQLLVRAELGSVKQILVSSGDDSSEHWEENEVCSLIAAQGFAAEECGTALLFDHANANPESFR
jgi:FkbM family methyltransferase